MEIRDSTYDTWSLIGSAILIILSMKGHCSPRLVCFNLMILLKVTGNLPDLEVNGGWVTMVESVESHGEC